MVIRNAWYWMVGLPVGDWIDRLDTECLRIDIVEAFKVCISDNAMWQRPVKVRIQSHRGTS
jgi:hypothetical protein